MTFKNNERIYKFALENIGLERGSVRLETHNPKWKRLFSDEAYLIFDELRIESLRLFHVGSTSVVGLDAKPIIDVLGSVESLEELDKKQQQLIDLGYEYKGEYGIEGRRYCVLYNPEKTIGYIHLHIYQHEHLEVEKHLSFRDHLRLSSNDRLKYLEHKRHLINNVKINRENYADAKNEVIALIQSVVKINKSSQKILVILGAAEGHKNTLAFIKDSYGDQVEIVDLNKIQINPYVYSNQIHDDFYSIIKKAKEADLVVLATPVYWYAMSGIMKDFMDRFSNLMSGEHKVLGESLYGKKVQLLSTGFDLKMPMGFEVPFAGTAIYFGMDYLGAIYKSVR